jgi:hypothetical protein
VFDIGIEHAFYLSNFLGDATISNCLIQHVGRTAVQITARSHEGTKKEGIGTITLTNITAIDCNLGDFFGGGSCFTFAGRHTGNIILDNCIYRAGFDSALNAIAKKVIGTGAFVSHQGDSTGNIPNGPISVINCDFQIAPGGGDRDFFQVNQNSCVSLIVSGSIITSGARAALNITLPKDQQNWGSSNNVTGECYLNGVKYNTYDEFLKATIR